MSKLRVGVIGAGLWGHNHATVFGTLEQTELVAVCDLDPARAEAMKADTGARYAFTDFRELIAHPDIDAVSIATPDFTHTPIILAALEANKHVLSEKPLATDLSEAEAIAEKAGGTSAKLMIDFHNRVNPIVHALREAVAGGEIGRVLHGMSRLSNTVFVPTEMLSWASKSSALWFLGSHMVDALRFVLGDEVVRVYAVTRAGTLKARGIDTKDFHVSVLEFSNGAVVTMENSWVLAADNPMVYDFKLELVGESGQIQADTSHNGGLRRLTGQGMRYTDILGVTPTGPGRIGGFALESVARFVDAVLGHGPLVADVEDGLINTRVLDAIERSAAAGVPVDL